MKSQITREMLNSFANPYARKPMIHGSELVQFKNRNALIGFRKMLEGKLRS